MVSCRRIAWYRTRASGCCVQGIAENPGGTAPQALQQQQHVPLHVPALVVEPGHDERRDVEVGLRKPIEQLAPRRPVLRLRRAHRAARRSHRSTSTEAARRGVSTSSGSRATSSAIERGSLSLRLERVCRRAASGGSDDSSRRTERTSACDRAIDGAIDQRSGAAHFEAHLHDAERVVVVLGAGSSCVGVDRPAHGVARCCSTFPYASGLGSSSFHPESRRSTCSRKAPSASGRDMLLPRTLHGSRAWRAS